jgi:hypothetical protein
MNVRVSGWIKGAEMDDLIEVHFGRPLERKSFIRTGHRRWVRSRVAHIRDVFEFMSLGHSLNPRWGFPLDYCPTVYGDDLKWHRTATELRVTAAPCNLFNPFNSFNLFIYPIRSRQYSSHHFPMNIRQAEIAALETIR